MADDPGAATNLETISAVLTDTAFGRAWMAHIVLATALVVVVFAWSERWAAIAILSGLMLASLGLVGHAAIDRRHRDRAPRQPRRSSSLRGRLDRRARSVRPHSRRVRPRRRALRRDAVTAMMRFSWWGHFVVAAIVATGIVNIALTSGRTPWRPTTPYRALLNVKIAVVAAMIGLAIVNRYAPVPRLKASANALSALRAISLVNIAIGTLVVALVSLFALLDPA